MKKLGKNQNLTLLKCGISFNFKKMKKLFLSMVFIFAFVTVTPTAANNVLNSDYVPIDCVQQAFDEQSALMNRGYSMEEANYIANIGYILCMFNTQ